MTTVALPVSGINDAEFIEQQIQARQNAKKVKDWALADKIRNNLKEHGVILEDLRDGSTVANIILINVRGYFKVNLDCLLN